MFVFLPNQNLAKSQYLSSGAKDSKSIKYINTDIRELNIYNVIMAKNKCHNGVKNGQSRQHRGEKWYRYHHHFLSFNIFSGRYILDFIDTICLQKCSVVIKMSTLSP